MHKLRGDQLFINLGASQVRRRLKGFGHGVRKVQSAGRNQAVVIHTATGQHLEALKAKFADVGCSGSGNELNEPIENLRNVGPISASWLRKAGIPTIAELERVGPALAFRRVRLQQPNASLNLLWAMVAGLADRDWRELNADERASVSAEVRELE